MANELKMRVSAIKACKTYGMTYHFTCPVCGKRAEAKKTVVGYLEIKCHGCELSSLEML